jgi:hypothetical protein
MNFPSTGHAAHASQHRLLEVSSGTDLCKLTGFSHHHWLHEMKGYAPWSIQTDPKPPDSD